MRITRLVPLFSLLFVQTMMPQENRNIEHQTLSWIRYYTIIPVAEKWDIHSEIDNRSFLIPVSQNVFVVRVQGRYRLNKATDFGGGFAYFNVNTQQPDNNPEYEIPEYRAQQDVTITKEISNFTLSNRFQLEERFIQKTTKTALLNEFSFALRFRYRLQVTSTLWEKDKKSLEAVVSDEILFNYGKENKQNFFDQNRIYAATRFHFNPTTGLELGFLKNFQRRASGVDFFDRDIIRLTFYHRFRKTLKS
jgi:hypothetical protein